MRAFMLLMRGVVIGGLVLFYRFNDRFNRAVSALFERILFLVELNGEF